LSFASGHEVGDAGSYKSGRSSLPVAAARSAQPGISELANMQLSIVSALVALAVGVSAQGATLSEVDGYTQSGCRSSSYDVTWITDAGNNIAEDGQCFKFPEKGYSSVQVSKLAESRGCAGRSP
jgi:hypothetical protein